MDILLFLLKVVVDVLLFIIVVVAIYLIAIKTRNPKNVDVKPLLNHFYAHRGFHDNKSDAPENSLLAFEKAVEHGYGIELDVQLTKDNVLVVFHDDTLKRVCGKEGALLDYTYAELMEFNLLDTDQKIPTFEQVLEVVDGKVPLIIEVKMPNTSTKSCEILNEQLKGYKGVFCVESFHPYALKWFKQNEPAIIRGQLSTKLNKDGEKPNPQYFVLEHLITNFMTRPDFIAYDHKYKDNLSRQLCKNMFGSLSVAWTIKSKEQLENCQNDFDLFIFEGFPASLDA